MRQQCDWCRGCLFRQAVKASLGEWNMLLLASLSIYFSSFCSRWGLWVWGNSGLQALAWIQHDRTHCLRSFPTFSDFLYSPPRFSGDRPPDSQKPSGEIVTEKKHGTETVKKHPLNPLFKGEEGFSWASEIPLLQGCGCSTMPDFTHRSDIPETGTIPKQSEQRTPRLQWSLRAVFVAWASKRGSIMN